jgi:hypothetical protein
VSAAASILLTAGLLLDSLLVGRLVVAGFGASLWQRFDANGAAASLVLGAAFLTLVSVGLSGAGFLTPDIVPLVPALMLIPLALAWRRRRLSALRPVGRARAWLTLGLPLAATAIVAHLPVLRTLGFAIGNDTYTYSAFAEWLQRHGFAERCGLDPLSPVTGIPWLWQSQHYDLGIAHLLALVQAATKAAVVTLVYPATAAVGMVAVAAAVWLAARELLRFGPAAACGVALVFAVAPHPLYWGHHNGFLQQTYALAVALVGVVLLTRAARPARLLPGNAVLVALPFVFLLIVYLPLLPALGLLATLAAFHAFRRARRRGQLRSLALFASGVAALFLVLGLRDLVGVVLRLHNFMTDVAGGHVPWSALEFFQFATGTRVLAPGWETVDALPWTLLNRALAPGYLALALVGLASSLQSERRRGLAAFGALLGLGILYYALWANDPWKQTRGHTWNVFKLSQWAFPAYLLLAAAGLEVVTRRMRTRSLWYGVALALPLSLVGAHWDWSRRLGLTMREILPGEAPLATLAALKQRIQGLRPGTLLVVGRPVNASRWLAAYTSLLAYPRAVLGDWADSASISNHPVGGEALYERALSRVDQGPYVALVAGYVPFEPAATEPLGAGYALLQQPLQPLVVHVVNPAGLLVDAETKRPSFRMGEGRTKVVVWAPDALEAQLDLTLRPYPGRPGTRLVAFLAGGDYSHRSVRLAAAEAPVAETRLSGETALHIPLELPAGLSTVVLLVDEGRGELDAREPVTVVGLRLSRDAAAASR